MTIEEARTIAAARAEVCTPRGKHRPIQTGRRLVDGEPIRYRFCGDCRSWNDPTPIYAQERRGR